MASVFRCDDCGFASFKTNQSFQAHLLTKKHKMRQENTREDLLQCKLCNKWYCGSSSFSHHKKNCTKSVREPVPVPIPPPPPTTLTCTTSTAEIQVMLQHQMEEMKQAFNKEREEMKIAFEESMKEQINKILEMHAGSTTNNNKNSHNNTVKTNNVTNININAFGNENTDYIDEKVILSCIDRVYKSIPSLLAKIHFDPKHPENHNIKITNKKLPYASVMGNNKKWKTVDRKDAIDTMVQNGFNMLDDTYVDNKEKFTSSKQHNFEGFLSKFESEDKDVIRQIKTEVDMMVINESGA